MSTFHSLCVRILRRDGDKLGIDRNFAIYDASDSQTAVKEAFRINNVDPKVFNPKAVKYAISDAKNN